MLFARPCRNRPPDQTIVSRLHRNGDTCPAVVSPDYEVSPAAPLSVGFDYVVVLQYLQDLTCAKAVGLELLLILIIEEETQDLDG